MTLNDVIIQRYKMLYSLYTYKRVSLLKWAIRWFKTSNDVFYDLYGFNFNPHKYPYLYEIARKEVYRNE